MKKFIYSCLFLAMAAITFSSCEDVPAPYNMPNEPETPEVTTDGTEANPYTVTDAKIAATGTNVFVKAFIVGYVPDKALNEAIFGDAASAENAPTNILVAASADETNVNNCMPIQLPAGAIRTALNLKDNPGNLKQEVILCGNIEKYFGETGLKSVAYAKIGNKEYGTKPDGSTTTPDTPTTGKGSASDPYTVAEAIAAIKAGAPTYEVYLTGIVSEVDFYNDQYKSLSYYISDDGKSKDMQVYSGKGLNGADFTSKDDLKVGQKVTIKGIIKAFNKNGTDIMEVDKNSTIVKIEGEGTGGEVTPKPDTPDTPSTTEGISVNGLTVTLTNSGATAGQSFKVEDLSTLKLDANPTEFTLSDGTIFKLDSNGNKTKPAYNEKAKELRIYANNIMTITGSKNIAKIILTCTHDNNKNTDCVGNETATINFSGKTATYTNVFTGTTGGGVQLRIKSIEIVYAK